MNTEDKNINTEALVKDSDADEDENELSLSNVDAQIDPALWKKAQN